MADVATGVGTEQQRKYIIASVSEVPKQHHELIVYIAAVLAFKKGTNPSKDAAALWQMEVDKCIPSLVNDVETRQGSDYETVEAYLEDEYDL